MQRFTPLTLCAAIAGLLAMSGASLAAEKTAAKNDASAQPPVAQKPAPEAMDALIKMGNYLQTIKNFGVEVNSTTDQVMEDGLTTQLVQFTHDTKLLVERPNHFRADIVGGAPGSSRHVYYDGKSFTMYTHPSNFYTVVSAPPTLKELSEVLENKYGVDLPLSDLFTLGVDQNGLKRIVSAVYLGDEAVGSLTCSHYAYHEKEADWQVWIQKGDQPLPCKLNIVTISDAERPQYTAVYHWNLNAEVTPKAFAFTPPANAHQIELVKVGSN